MPTRAAFPSWPPPPSPPSVHPPTAVGSDAVRFPPPPPLPDPARLRDDRRAHAHAARTRGRGGGGDDAGAAAGGHAAAASASESPWPRPAAPPPAGAAGAAHPDTADWEGGEVRRGSPLFSVFSSLFVPAAVAVSRAPHTGRGHDSVGARARSCCQGARRAPDTAASLLLAAYWYPVGSSKRGRASQGPRRRHRHSHASGSVPRRASG